MQAVVSRFDKVGKYEFPLTHARTGLWGREDSRKGRSSHAAGSLSACALAAVLLAFASSFAHAQIGGKTAADGPFTLDNAEDLDLVADGVMRDWVSDYVTGFGSVLSVLPLSGSGLTLAPGQTPTGAFRATVPASSGYVDAGFGVPMPAVAGASTATDPGNITSFNYLSFLACFDTTLPNQKFQILLETYPEVSPGVYPQIIWNFSPAHGGAFQRVVADLKNPAGTVNAGGYTVNQLLSQTRFLYFYCYGGPAADGTQLRFNIDDIRLTETNPGNTSVMDWRHFN